MLSVALAFCVALWGATCYMMKGEYTSSGGSGGHNKEVLAAGGFIHPTEEKTKKI